MYKYIQLYEIYKFYNYMEYINIYNYIKYVMITILFTNQSSLLSSDYRSKPALSLLS